MTAFTKVMMHVTDTDIDNAEMLSQAFHTKGNGGAVSIALRFTRTLVEMVKNGNELLLKNKKGQLEKIFISGINDE